MLASSPSIDPATMLCPQGKIGGMREGGGREEAIAALICVACASIIPLPPAAREAAGAGGGISALVCADGDRYGKR
jgi:hypothetical protein